MAKWDKKTHYYSGQGVVLIGEYNDAGQVTGLEPVGNVPSLKIGIETSSVEHKESQSGQRAVDLRLATEIKTRLSATLENFDRAGLAMALRGEYAAIAAGMATDVPLACYPGKVVALPHIKISGLTLEKDSVPLKEYTSDDQPWDYKINAEAGSVRFNDTMSTASVAAGDALTAAYSYAAQARVDALTTSPQPRFLRFEGLNTVDGNNPVVVEAFRFVIDPAKELALIAGEEVASFELEGSLMADSTRAAGSKFFHQRLVR